MSELKNLNVRSGAVKRQIKTFAASVNEETSSLSQLEARYDRMPTIWEKFENLSVEIECLLEGEKHIEAHIQDFEEYEKYYYQAVATAWEELERNDKKDN